MDAWEPTWPGRPAGPSSLGQRIAGLRGERGWTQQQLADRLGISRVAVSHLETDLNTPGERTVALLAGLFRREPHELVDGTSYPMAKRDRLPLVAARWTEVEHLLALLDVDLWWLDQIDGADGAADRGVVESRMADWDVTLSGLAKTAHDPGELAEIADGRRRLADRLARGRVGPDTEPAAGVEG